MKTWILVAAAVAAWASAGLAAEGDPEANPLSGEEQARIIEAFTPSVVAIEYGLKYSRGRVPTGGDVSYLCPNCGSYHTRAVGSDLIENRRPLEEVGFVLDATTVVTRDITIAPEFIRSIRVLHGGRSVEAEATGYALAENAMFLRLKEPLAGLKPLAFQARAGGDLSVITCAQHDGRWMISVKPLPDTLYVDERGLARLMVPVPCLVIDKDRRPVGLTLNGELPANPSWQGSPLAWKALSDPELKERLSRLETLADNALLRVTLNFRSSSSKKDPADLFRRRISFGGEQVSDTEVDAVGIALGQKRLLVLANLPPETTARLEKIRIFDKDDKAIGGTFVASLRDFGALLVEADAELPGIVAIQETEPRALKHTLLLKADLKVAGEQRTADYWTGRITAFTQGRDNQLYPKIAGRDSRLFWFNQDLELVLLPVILKDRAKSALKRRYQSEQPETVSAAYLRAGMERTDPANAPLDENREKQIAWLGVSLQKMTPEMARANKCTRETRNGEIGAMIAKVYPGSPAEKAGVQQGMILLRLELDDEAAPLDVIVEDSASDRSPIPWDRLDEVPAQYLDQIPPPWPAVENSLTRLLTDLGVGTDYTAYFLDKGRDLSKAFTVVKSPTHYNAAPRCKSEAIGLTVRDLTFEVRDFLQKKEGDPGVVVSKVEPGGKAAVSGIKPFEVITHINGQPVADVAAFEKLAGAQESLTLSISRMADTRQVSINMADAR